MTTSDRYEVGLEDTTSVDNVSTFAEARRLAHAVKKANREATIYIYDRMAHIGKAELWHVVGGLSAGSAQAGDLRVVRVRERHYEQHP